MDRKADDKTALLEIWDLARRSGIVDPKRFTEGKQRIEGLNSMPLDPSTVLVDAGLTPEQVQQFRAMSHGGGEEMLGRRIGRYVITGELGAGAMGTVFRARDEELGREAALKVLHSDIVPHSAAMLDRFLLEARALTKVKHPNIVGVYESGQAGGVAYLALEYIEGGCLASQDYGRLDTRRKLQIARDVARALEHAHTAGLVHRDVKPSNILLRPDGAAVLSDFGLVRDESLQVRLTQSVAWIGTPAYMSPEQAEGYTPRIDHRTDIYSLGVVIFELFAGRVPFPESSIDALRRRIVSEDVSPLSQVSRGVSRALDAVVTKALERRPDERYPSAKAMADDLDRLLQGEMPSVRPPTPLRRAWMWMRRRPVWAAAVGATLLLGGVVGALLAQPKGAGIAREVAERLDEVVRRHVEALHTAARRMDVPRVSAALETYHKDPRSPLDVAQADIETERLDAHEGHPFLVPDGVIVVDKRDVLLLPRSPSPQTLRVQQAFARGGRPPDLLIDDGEGAWLFGAEPIRYPGNHKLAGWTLVGERVAESWFHEVIDPRGGAFAWVAADGQVVYGAGMTIGEARDLATARSAGRTHAWLKGRDCLLVATSLHGWPCLVAVPGGRFRGALVYVLAGLAGIGCVVIALASVAAWGAARASSSAPPPVASTVA